MLPASFAPVSCALEAVYLWSWSIQEAHLEFYNSLLAEEELRRAESIGSVRRRQEFICGRGGLRLLLGCYLGRSPRELPITLTASGKPVLADSPWQFNLSHSHNLVLCAIAQRCPVGVDVEYRQRPCAMARILHRYLPLESFQGWQALPPEQQEEAFWRWWTQKEAIAKACGTGIYHQPTAQPPLQTITFGVSPDYIASVCVVRGAYLGTAT